MQFTPQQLAGGPKFSSVTRIGNWQEELALDEAKANHFLRRATNGDLSAHRLDNKLAICTSTVPHSFSYDGNIHFGDYVMLSHDSSGSLLACDPFEECPVSPDARLVTTTAVNGPGGMKPKARHMFRIEQPPQNLQDRLFRDTDDLLKIGQPFMLVCVDELLAGLSSQKNTSFLPPPLYLASTKKNERFATKRTNRQLVFMTPIVDADAIWTLSLPSYGKLNGASRFLAKGSPASVDGAWQLTHRQTNMYLSCDSSVNTATEFGVEYECFADRSTAPGKMSLMLSERSGQSTPHTLAKPDTPVFAWHFVYATSEDNIPSQLSRTLPPPASPNSVLSTVRQLIKDHGVDAFWNLRKYLLDVEEKLTVPGTRDFGYGNKVDRSEIVAALIGWGIDIDSKYLDMIMNSLDQGHHGMINVRDVMELLWGENAHNHTRINAIRAAFNRIDRNSQGWVTSDDIVLRFSGVDHPLVSVGGYDDQYALQHMLSFFETRGRAVARISLELFSSYYNDFGAAVDDDDYFVAVLESNWP